MIASASYLLDRIKDKGHKKSFLNERKKIMFSVSPEINYQDIDIKSDFTEFMICLHDFFFFYMI